MAPRIKRLGVWLDDVRVAELEERRWPEIRCRYTQAALQSAPLNSPLLSCSLPLGGGPQDATAFCQGLLPEGQALQAMAARAGVAVNATFELLGRYGRDVAGALVIGTEEPAERQFGTETYNAATLANAIEELDDYPLGVHDDSELSLAGLQDKLLLVRLKDGKWARPLGGCPSTHILKVDDPRHRGLIAAESLCLDLARSAGLTTANSELVQIGGNQCLIISRFDRQIVGGEVRRIHQEDLCQALGVDPVGARGRAKYEDGGGPTLRQTAGLLDAYAVDSRRQLDRLVAAITFTILIGNADAHGKNLALLHSTQENIELAPLYDTVPSALWANLRTKAAMAIGGQVDLSQVSLEDIVREAKTWPHSDKRARKVALDTINKMTNALDSEMIPNDSDVAALVRERAGTLLS